MRPRLSRRCHCSRRTASTSFDRRSWLSRNAQRATGWRRSPTHPTSLRCGKTSTSTWPSGGRLITGLAIAYYLKTGDPSLRVALLESQRLGSGSSSRNSGAVAPRFRGNDSTEDSLAAYALLKEFAEQEGIDVDLREDEPAIYLHHRPPRGGNPDLSGEALAREIGSGFYAAADVTTTNSVHPGKLVAGLIQVCARVGVELY